MKHTHASIDAYEKKWVALSPDRSKVISSNENLMQLKRDVAGQKVVYMKVPPTDSYLSF